MKDLEEAKRILRMEITRDRGSGRLSLSQENYILKVLEKFNMVEVRPVTSLLACHFKYPPSGVHNHERGGGYVSNTICQCGGFTHVCYGLH